MIMEENKMFKQENGNVLIPVVLWNELKNDLYFNEFIELMEDRQELLDAKEESTEFFDFREYDKQRMNSIANV